MSNRFKTITVYIRTSNKRVQQCWLEYLCCRSISKDSKLIEFWVLLFAPGRLSRQLTCSKRQWWLPSVSSSCKRRSEVLQGLLLHFKESSISNVRYPSVIFIFESILAFNCLQFSCILCVCWMLEFVCS